MRPTRAIMHVGAEEGMRHSVRVPPRNQPIPEENGSHRGTRIRYDYIRGVLSFLRIERVGGGAILAKVEDAAISVDFAPLWERQHDGDQARKSLQDFGAGGETKGWTNLACLGARFSE